MLKKLNIKRLLTCLTSFLVIGMLLLTAVYSPAKAAFGAVEPSQYVVNQIVDGDTKTIIYQFTGFQPYCVDTRNNTLYEQGIINGTKQVSTEGDVPISLNFYPFGKKFYLNQPIYTGSAIDVRDIIPGAELSLNFSFLTKFSQVTNLEGITVTYNATAACYDKDGKYLRRSFIEKQVSAIDVALDKTIGMNLEMVIQSDVAYVAVYSTYSFKATVYDFVCNITPQPLQLSVPINMIYENSQMMGAIKNELGDLNDKADEIIGGSPEMNDTAESIGDSMGEAVEDMEQAGEAIGSLNKPDINVDSLIPNEQMQGQAYLVYTGLLAKFWRNDTLMTMVSIMGGMCVISYLLFASKG